MSPSNLMELSAEEFSLFLDSFDHVLCDKDGVILTKMKDVVPGALETFRSLKSLGKTFRIVSNNSSVSLEDVAKGLQDLGYNIEKEDIIVPLSAIIDYLKSINFDKKLFVIGLSSFKQSFRSAGFDVAGEMPSRIEETIPAFLDIFKDDKDIGAVIFDLDYNLNALMMYKACVYLERKDVLFLSGSDDDKLPFATNPVLGPGYFLKVLSSFTERKCNLFGKPSTKLNDYIIKRYKISDPSRVLFIGDSPAQDMAFGTYCGYKKLLVLTGNAKLSDLETLKPQEMPDYYTHSLADLYSLMAKKTSEV